MSVWPEPGNESKTLLSCKVSGAAVSINLNQLTPDVRMRFSVEITGLTKPAPATRPQPPQPQCANAALVPPPLGPPRRAPRTQTIGPSSKPCTRSVERVSMLQDRTPSNGVPPFLAQSTMPTMGTRRCSPWLLTSTSIWSWSCAKKTCSTQASWTSRFVISHSCMKSPYGWLFSAVVHGAWAAPRGKMMTNCGCTLFRTVVGVSYKCDISFGRSEDASRKAHWQSKTSGQLSAKKREVESRPMTKPCFPTISWRW
mmetsp:Transcript_92961/g.240154  ORF Transcript_92961/g.240154 Transcript_92961/m.240154 type:complete len:255 (-) Transcript_92961:1077-1841(-)